MFKTLLENRRNKKLTRGFIKQEKKRERILSKLDPRVRTIENDHLRFRAFVFNGVTEPPDLAMTPVVFEEKSRLPELRKVMTAYEKRSPYSKKLKDATTPTISDGVYGDVPVKLFSDLETLRDNVFFLSYAHLDLNHMDNFFELLNVDMSLYGSFIDTKYMFDPNHWRKFISEAIGRGTIVVVFWTNRSKVSEAVSYEIQLASERGAIIIVIRVDGTHFPFEDCDHFLVDFELPRGMETLKDTEKCNVHYTSTGIAQELVLLGYALRFIAQFPRELHRDLWELIVLTHRLRPPPRTLIPCWNRN